MSDRYVTGIVRTCGEQLQCIVGGICACEIEAVLVRNITIYETLSRWGSWKKRGNADDDV